METVYDSPGVMLASSVSPVPGGGGILPVQGMDRSTSRILERVIISELKDTKRAL